MTHQNAVAAALPLRSTARLRLTGQALFEFEAMPPEFARRSLGLNRGRLPVRRSLTALQSGKAANGCLALSRSQRAVLQKSNQFAGQIDHRH